MPAASPTRRSRCTTRSRRSGAGDRGPSLQSRSARESSAGASLVASAATGNHRRLRRARLRARAGRRAPALTGRAARQRGEDERRQAEPTTSRMRVETELVQQARRAARRERADRDRGRGRRPPDRRQARARRRRRRAGRPRPRRRARRRAGAGRRRARRATPASHPGAVKSPMVGTVYLSGEPGAQPFVARRRRGQPRATPC